MVADYDVQYNKDSDDWGAKRAGASRAAGRNDTRLPLPCRFRAPTAFTGAPRLVPAADTSCGEATRRGEPVRARPRRFVVRRQPDRADALGPITLLPHVAVARVLPTGG